MKRLKFPAFFKLVQTNKKKDPSNFMKLHQNHNLIVIKQKGNAKKATKKKEWSKIKSIMQNDLLLVSKRSEIIK